MPRPFAVLAALAILVPLTPLQAATERLCYQDACAEVTVPQCAEGDRPLKVSIGGKLNNPHRMSVTAYQLVANAEWEYTDNHQVKLLAGDPVDSKGFLFASEFEHELTLPAADLKSLTLVFGPRSGGHGFYDVAVDIKVGSGAPQQVQLDIKPGSCPNPVNRDKKGITPVAVVGSAAFDVRNIDLYSVQLAGVAPLRYSYSDVTSALDPASWTQDCTTARGDGNEDLTLKFATQELLSALERQLGRPLFDGEMVTVPFSAGLKSGDQCSGELSGQEIIQIISKRQ